jgi:hypothetical protein
VSAPWRRWCGARTPVGTTRRQPATTRNDIPTKHHSRAWQFQPNDSPSLSLSLSLLRVSFWCRVDAVTPCNLPRGIYFCVGSKCWLVSHSSQSFENISAEKMTTSDDYTYWISFPAGARTSDEFTLNYSSSENLFVDHNSSGELSLDGERTSLVQWDDWDQSLWTAEQRQLLERGAIPPEVHITLGVLLTLIVLFGVAANSSIFYVFAR